MDYVIGNKEERVYIRIEEGKAVTCGRDRAQCFEYSKACNIRNNLPKTLSGTKFSVMAVSGCDPVRLDVRKASKVLDKEANRNSDKEAKKICLRSTSYEIPKTVYQWMDRVQNCSDLIQDAQKRKSELEEELTNNNNILVNVEHTIELEGKKNVYEGYVYYVALRDCLIKRRQIKDELAVIETITESDLTAMSDCSRQVENKIRAMVNRRFEYREVKMPRKEAS